MSGEPRYEPVANPYAPGAGTPPPALVGRDAELETGRLALARLLRQRPAQHLLVHGLRGVGKTALLRAVGSTAQRQGYHPLRLEADAEGDTVAALLRQCRRLLADLEPTRLVRRALRVLSSVALTVPGTDVRLEAKSRPGVGEVGSLFADLPDLMVALAEAAREQEGGIFLAIDEAQTLPRDQMAAMLGSLHLAGQEQLPVWAALAGLPNLLGRATAAKTYAERMFVVAELGPLPDEAAGEAIRTPAVELGAAFSDDAVAAIVAESGGYPYFLQSWGFHTWNVAVDEPISAADVDRAAPAVRRALDDAFFAARLARIPPSQLSYARALAELGPGPHRSGAVAEHLGRATQGVAAVRDRLVSDGLLYSPRYGLVAFAVPQLDDYLRRNFPRLGDHRDGS